MKVEIYKDEGYKLMGAAFEVYNEQGFGPSEEIYQESLELAQLPNYMRITKQPVGYLINFGHKDRLEWKHFILFEFIAEKKD